VADSDAKPLSESIGWALARGLRLAVATCVVALILTTTLVGAAAERLATAAYLAAIFAAATLASQRLFHADLGEDRKRVWAPAFPSFLAFFSALALSVSVLGALVSQPGGEVTALLWGVVFIFVAAFVRSGAIVAMHRALVRGGPLAAATRYAVVACLCMLVVTALLPSYVAEPVAQFAYRLAIVVTLFTAVGLIAPTRVGLWAQQSWRNLLVSVDRASRAFVFERTATYAAIVAVAALLRASTISASAAEVFTIIAYCAATVAAFGVAMECRRLRG
jgi:hypothetical protein